MLWVSVGIQREGKGHGLDVKRAEDRFLVYEKRIFLRRITPGQDDTHATSVRPHPTQVGTIQWTSLEKYQNSSHGHG